MPGCCPDADNGRGLMQIDAGRAGTFRGAGLELATGCITGGRAIKLESAAATSGRVGTLLRVMG